MKITPKSTTGVSAAAPKSSVKRAQGASSANRSAAPKDVSSVLGIPEAEFTPRVRDAVMKLMAEVDRLRQELEAMKRRLDKAEEEADQDGLLPVLNRRAFVREMTRIMSFGERYDLEIGRASCRERV